jgi:hypothetical protein
VQNAGKGGEGEDDKTKDEINEDNDEGDGLM